MPKTVAILVFDEVEVLDFAGPFEVFAVAWKAKEEPAFRVLTVAPAAGVVRARNGLKVVPDHAIADCPAADILVIPGGFGTRALVGNDVLIKWIQERSASSELTMSVCTGSLLLAKAGLLDGLRATTHHGALDLLRSLAPRASDRSLRALPRQRPHSHRSGDLRGDRLLAPCRRPASLAKPSRTRRPPTWNTSAGGDGDGRRPTGHFGCGVPAHGRESMGGERPMTPESKPSKLAFIVAFAAIYLIWGSTYLGIRVAVDTMPPILMAGVRFAIGGIVLFTFLKLRGAPWPTAVQWRDQAVVGTFLLLGGNAIVSWAELRTPSGITAMILGASPIIVVFFDWLRPGGKRPTAGIVAGVVVGIVGLALLVGPGAIPADARPPIANIVAIMLSSVFWWIGSFYSKHAKTKTPILLGSSMQMLCGSACILLTGWVLGEGRGFHIAAVSPHSWTAFTYLVIVGSIIVFPVYGWLLEHSTPAKVSTFAYVNPVVAIFLGWALLGEPLNLRIIAAAAVIIGAVAIITVSKARTQEKP